VIGGCCRRGRGCPSCRRGRGCPSCRRGRGCPSCRRGRGCPTAYNSPSSRPRRRHRQQGRGRAPLRGARRLALPNPLQVRQLAFPCSSNDTDGACKSEHCRHTSHAVKRKQDYSRETDWLEPVRMRRVRTCVCVGTETSQRVSSSHSKAVSC
jgi:hypothetical protein